MNILIVKRKATASLWTIRNSVEALRSLGHRVEGVELDRYVDSESLKRKILDFRPQFFLAINHLGVDPRLQSELGIPTASWFNEDPFYWVRREMASEGKMIFVFDRYYIPLLKRFGFRDVFYLPMATNQEVFRRIELSDEERGEFECELSFAGGSYYHASQIIEEYLREWNSLQIRSIVEEVSNLQAENFQFHIGDILDEVQRKHRYFLPFEGWEDRVMFERLLAGVATYLYRKRIIGQICDFGPRLYGDEGWKMVIGDGCNCIHKRRIGYYSELPKLFNACLINLSLPTTPIKTGVSSRIFDILSCGGFVIAAYRSDIANLFKLDEEVVCFHDIDDLREKIDYYLAHPKEREEIARRGQQKVLKRDTYRDRMMEMVRILKGVL
jgi:spore maturation protein CgeB